MQNSLSRLFEGMAHALHHDVLPFVEDDYAGSQITACIELLGNLQSRVIWDPQLLRTRSERIRVTIQQVAGRLPEVPELAEVRALANQPAGSLDDRADLQGLLRALADLQRWLGDHPDHPAVGLVESLVAEDLRDELERLQTASFGRRLQQPSPMGR